MDVNALITIFLKEWDLSEGTIFAVQREYAIVDCVFSIALTRIPFGLPLILVAHFHPCVERKNERDFAVSNCMLRLKLCFYF